MIGCVSWWWIAGGTIVLALLAIVVCYALLLWSLGDLWR